MLIRFYSAHPLNAPFKKGASRGGFPLNQQWGFAPHPTLGVSQRDGHCYARPLAVSVSLRSVKGRVVFSQAKISTLKPLTALSLSLSRALAHISFLERWGVQGGTPCIDLKHYAERRRFPPYNGVASMGG